MPNLFRTAPRNPQRQLVSNVPGDKLLDVLVLLTTASVSTVLMSHSIYCLFSWFGVLSRTHAVAPSFHLPVNFIRVRDVGPDTGLKGWLSLDEVRSSTD